MLSLRLIREGRRHSVGRQWRAGRVSGGGRERDEETAAAASGRGKGVWVVNVGV